MGSQVAAEVLEPEAGDPAPALVGRAGDDAACHGDAGDLIGGAHRETVADRLLYGGAVPPGPDRLLAAGGLKVAA
jgi:hypothetical protein